MLNYVVRITLTLLSGILLAFGGRPPGLPQPATRARLRVPILMYHYISANPSYPGDPVRTRLSVTPAAFAEQLRYLQRAGYTAITLDDLVAALRDGAALPARPVILTFDDGYQDFYDNAYPLLKQYGDRATIYIITGKVSHAGYMTWSELSELAGSPLITIGAHTRSHPDLARIAAPRSWAELAGSKKDLDQRLGITVRHVAYPAGEYNLMTLAQAAAIGFSTGVTTREGLDQRGDGLLVLDRVRVNGYAGLTDLIQGLEGRRGPAKRSGGRPGVDVCQHRAREVLDECQSGAGRR